MSWKFCNVKHYFTVKPKTCLAHSLKIRQITGAIVVYSRCCLNCTIGKTLQFTDRESDTDLDSVNIETFACAEMNDPTHTYRQRLKKNLMIGKRWRRERDG